MDCQGLLRHHQWMARIGGHNRCSQFDPFGLGNDSGQGGQNIGEACSPHCHPDLLNACMLDLAYPGNSIHCIPGLNINSNALTECTLPHHAGFQMLTRFILLFRQCFLLEKISAIKAECKGYGGSMPWRLCFNQECVVSYVWIAIALS